MVILMLAAFQPGFRFAVGDPAEVLELFIGVEFMYGKTSVSLEMGRIVSGDPLNLDTLSTMAEGGVDTSRASGVVVPYSSLLMVSVRFTLLNLEGWRVYAVGGAGFQKPSLSGDVVYSSDFDFTYMGGVGVKFLAGRIFSSGDLWDRVYFFLETGYYRLKVPVSLDFPNYVWKNVPDWKLGLIMGF